MESTVNETEIAEVAASAAPLSAAVLRERILAAKDLEREAVFVREWGVTLYVRSMTSAERASLEEGSQRTNGRNVQANLKDLRQRVVQLTTEDEAGRPVFTGDDIAALGGKNAAAIDALVAVGFRLSGIGREAVESLGKASGSDRADDG